MYFSDTPEKKDFSQHVNILAVLTGCVSPSEQKKLIVRVAGDQSLIQCTYFFRFYLTQAMKMAGVADRYTDQLKPWRDMLDLGLTTFAEKPEPVRSDCHAWSASPNYDFLATVCGIEPGEPGFRSVKIQPNMGKLQWIDGKMPHPGGDIIVKLKRRGSSGIEGEVILPPGLKGVLIWEGKSSGLKAGANNIIYKR